jgi:RNA exonuclease 1
MKKKRLKVHKKKKATTHREWTVQQLRDTMLHTHNHTTHHTHDQNAQQQPNHIVLAYVPGLVKEDMPTAMARNLRLPQVPRHHRARALATELLRVPPKPIHTTSGSASLPPKPPLQQPTLGPPATPRAGEFEAAYVREFLLSESELRENGYPEPLADGLIATFGGFSDEARRVGAPKLFAIDCEMCLAGEIKQLARIAVVDERMELVVDELVRPEMAVTDYLTRYSGITAELLQTARISAADARAKLLALLRDASSPVVLVGHSLENDLQALGIAHDSVLDTALLYPLQTRSSGPPCKAPLRALALRHLGRAIQRSTSGHDPREDASAAMELALLKLSRGHGFGEGWAEGGALCDELRSSGVRHSIIDRLLHLTTRSSLVGSFGSACESDEQAIEAATAFVRASDSRSVVWLALRAIQHVHDTDRGHAARASAVAQVNSGLVGLHRALPRGTLVLTVGSGALSHRQFCNDPEHGCVAVKQCGVEGDTPWLDPFKKQAVM